MSKLGLEKVLILLVNIRNFYYYLFILTPEGNDQLMISRLHLLCFSFDVGNAMYIENTYVSSSLGVYFDSLFKDASYFAGKWYEKKAIYRFVHTTSREQLIYECTVNKTSLFVGSDKQLFSCFCL